MSAALDAVLSVAPGTGLVARNPTAVLFVPQRDAALVAAFRGCSPGDELQAIASATVSAGFEVGPFACLSWSGEVRVMAFGELSIETDQPSMPMLSGAGSRTWVEHTLPIRERAALTVDGADADASTDVVAGVALAGGFRLELAAAAAAPASARPQPELAAADASAFPIPAARPEPEPAMSTLAPPAPDRPPSVDVAETDRTVAVPRPPAPLAEDAPDWHDPDVTLPPPASETVLAEVRSPDVGARTALVDAKVCGRGHPNPPTAAMCEVCAELLPPGATALVHLPRPSLGHLRLDDGELVPLDAELLLGRNPDKDTDPDRAGLRRVKTPGEKVSRTHLAVRFQGWDVLVEDCGSTNGTFVVPHPGGQVVPLVPERPQLVAPGAVVYFGSRSFTVGDRSEAR